MTAPLSPGSTIGIVGTGQLGRMLATAAARLGFRVHIFGPEQDPPAARVADLHVCAAYEDKAALARFAEAIDVATYEFENIPPLTVRTLREAGVPVRPDDNVLAVCQDRVVEKAYLRAQGLATAPYVAVDGLSDLTGGLAQIGGTAVLKTRQFGYDGKGQARIKPGDDPGMAFEACGGQPSILEGFVDFDFEVSLIGARTVSGDTAFFDMPRNTHKDGILDKSEIPGGLSHAVAEQARSLVIGIMEDLDYVGVLTVEFFWSRRQGLVANEMAPRVHNSGHWTVEACATDQFEQHIRAVAGWPLGDPSRHSDAVMTNLIGKDADQWQAIAADPKRSLTLYGKAEARRGRKMGHTVSIVPIKPWRTGRDLIDQ